MKTMTWFRSFAANNNSNELKLLKNAYRVVLKSSQMCLLAINLKFWKRFDTTFKIEQF